MADTAWRALERRAAGEDPEAQAALLRARLRQGDLDPERLRLACYLGHAPAALALGVEAPRAEGDLREWLWGLVAWGYPVLVRALLVCCERLLAYGEEEPGEARRLAETLAASAVAWCDAPGPEEQRALALAAADALGCLAQAAGREPAAWSALWGLHCAARAAALGGERGADKRALHHAALALRVVREQLGEVTVRELIQEEVGGWALRERFPGG